MSKLKLLISDHHYLKIILQQSGKYNQ